VIGASASGEQGGEHGRARTNHPRRPGLVSREFATRAARSAAIRAASCLEAVDRALTGPAETPMPWVRPDKVRWRPHVPWVCPEEIDRSAPPRSQRSCHIPVKSDQAVFVICANYPAHSLIWVFVAHCFSLLFGTSRRRVPSMCPESFDANYIGPETLPEAYPPMTSFTWRSIAYTTSKKASLESS
jgi:hypothetical protein